MRHPADFILFHCAVDAVAAPGLAAAAQRVCAQSPIPMAPHRAARTPGGQIAYVYARLEQRMLVDGAQLARLEEAFSRACPAARELRASRLERIFDAPGRSQGAAPAFHYVVETDAQEGWMPEISRWYDTEHMPGLAGVQGCIHAMRMTNHDHGPASFACYDLVSADTVVSPGWLAVRGTAWSAIARPHFTNTRRTMFEVLGGV